MDLFIRQGYPEWWGHMTPAHEAIAPKVAPHAPKPLPNEKTWPGNVIPKIKPK